MRAAAVLLVLGLLFGAAWLWQAGVLGASRAARAEATGRPRGAAAGLESLPEGWGVVTVGEPSGAEPVEVPRRGEPGRVLERPGTGAGAAAAAAAPGQDEEDQAESWRALEQRALGDYRIDVRAGQTLSEICSAHYGTAAAGLVEALARYNGLESADAIAEGETLLLPDRARLDGGTEEP